MPIPAAHIKAVCKLLRACQHRYDLYNLFSDCMEAAALAIANSVDLRQREAREARYMAIVGRYDRPVIETFPKVLAEVTMALEAEPCDVLGDLFGELELFNKARGQFFTPYFVARMMAEITLGSRQDALALIERHGFITAMEPACGAGSMVIALAQAMHRLDLNYQQHLHVTAVDIDPRVAHMAYIQFSLLHIPAVVIIGNSLSLEVREHWFTPAHILGGWNAKLAERKADGPPVPVASMPARDQHDDLAPVPADAPPHRKSRSNSPCFREPSHGVPVSIDHSDTRRTGQSQPSTAGAARVPYLDDLTDIDPRDFAVGLFDPPSPPTVICPLRD
jgi:hypothetical protein